LRPNILAFVVLITGVFDEEAIDDSFEPRFIRPTFIVPTVEVLAGATAVFVPTVEVLAGAAAVFVPVVVMVFVAWAAVGCFATI
jgi:hypothetical protein